MATRDQSSPSPSAGDALHEAKERLQRRSVEEFTDRNVRRIVELERVAKSSTTFGERLAARISAFCGTLAFVWINIAWLGAWMLYNTSSYVDPHPDPFPFTFLSFLIALEAIFLSAFILISQNQETRLSEQRSHLDLQINLLTEQENTHMLRMLESIAAKIGAEIDEHPDLAVLRETTRPESLVQQIDKATEQTAQEKSE